MKNQFSDIPHPSCADSTLEIKNGKAEYDQEHEFL
jgi:hypothetical protein